MSDFSELDGKEQRLLQFEKIFKEREEKERLRVQREREKGEIFEQGQAQAQSPENEGNCHQYIRWREKVVLKLRTLFS